MNQLYRQQLLAEEESYDAETSSMYGYGAAPQTSYGSVARMVEDNQRKQHIEMQYLTEIEARCRALMKEQQKQYNPNPVDLATMKLLEKSTRTLWVSKISEMITEKRMEEYCKLYGDVLGVNIVEDDGKRCGFIEFAS